MPTVWLVGMMGAGKTAVGRGLAKRLGVAFVDIDASIEAEHDCTIAELWRREGEPAFRDLEETHVEETAGREAVVATGGGVVLRSANIERMQSSGPVVWLKASVEVLALRVGAGSNRPLLAGQETRQQLDTILAERSELYEAASTVAVDTDRATVDEVVREVERWIAF
jgi:shikimate kinase